MVRNKSHFGAAKFKDSKSPNERKIGIRQENKVSEEIPLILFSFKDFDSQQCPPGQTFKQWENLGLLSNLMTKFVDLNNMNRVEATQRKCIELYKSFPPVSDFKIPNHIKGDVTWGTIQDIGGQKHRVAGYMIGNVFYVVFLDKDHKFWKMRK